VLQHMPPRCGLLFDFILSLMSHLACVLLHQFPEHALITVHQTLYTKHTYLPTLVA
jgi:hypothetical protein